MRDDTADEASVEPTTDETVRVGRFETASGEVIPDLRLAYATYGTFDGSNALLVCHPLTASHRPAGGDGPFDGWWDELIGPGRVVDTTEWFVVCVNVPGSPHGSSSPVTQRPDGDRWGGAFPQITVGDWARAQRRLLDRLGIDRLAAVVGGSVGGMNAIEWARRYPDSVDRVAAVATGPRLGPQPLAFDAVARRAIRDDPAWQGGEYHASDDRPTAGLATARRIGHLLYLSADTLRRRFGRQPATAVAAGDDGGSVTGGLPAAVADRADREGTYWAVESYLDYNAERFARRFDPASYCRLLRAMDEYDLAAAHGSDEAALAGFDGELSLVSYTGDWHFTVEDSRRLADAAAAAGVATTHHRIDDGYGHDAFLVHQESLVEPLCELLATESTASDSHRLPIKPDESRGWTCR